MYDDDRQIYEETRRFQRRTDEDAIIHNMTTDPDATNRYALKCMAGLTVDPDAVHSSDDDDEVEFMGQSRSRDDAYQLDCYDRSGGLYRDTATTATVVANRRNGGSSTSSSWGGSQGSTGRYTQARLVFTPAKRRRGDRDPEVDDHDTGPGCDTVLPPPPPPPPDASYHLPPRPQQRGRGAGGGGGGGGGYQPDTVFVPAPNTDFDFSKIDEEERASIPELHAHWDECQLCNLKQTDEEAESNPTLDQLISMAESNVGRVQPTKLAAELAAYYEREIRPYTENQLPMRTSMFWTHFDEHAVSVQWMCERSNRVINRAMNVLSATGIFEVDPTTQRERINRDGINQYMRMERDRRPMLKTLSEIREAARANRERIRNQWNL